LRKEKFGVYYWSNIVDVLENGNNNNNNNNNSNKNNNKVNINNNDIAEE
jgi:hypothetical protein